MQKLRKFLVLSVMALTVLSMSMVVAPVSQAADASAGDLIKMDGLSSVYYLGSDGKRYPFPNEKTYFSWYSDWSGVKTISQSELESYPLASKNVVVRAGTYLVKITTDPTVYAVEPNGVLRSIVSEENAINLWGADWAKRVIDIPDSFFTNYTVSDPLNVGEYPAGSLVKMADSADVYYINENGEAQTFDGEAAFFANFPSFDFVVTAPDDYTLPPLGDVITGAVESIVDTSQGGGAGPGVQPGAGTGLSVALSGDTLPSTTFPSHSTLIPFVTVNLTASNDGDVTVNDITFTRFGAGNYTEFSGGFLFVDGKAISTEKNVTSDHLITFNGLGLTIPAGTTKAVTLKMNAKTTGTVSGNHGFKIASASDITTNGATVSGSFPVSGNIMSFSSSASAGTVTLDGNGDSITRYVGENDVLLGEIDVKVSGDEDVMLYSVRLKQIGTASDDAVSNLYLTIDSETVASDVSVVNDYAYFELDNPMLLEKSKSYTLDIYGDIASGVNKTVEFIVRNDADIDARGTAFGENYSAMINRSAANESADVDTITIRGAEVTVSFDGPAATEIKADTTDVVLANFKFMVDKDDVSIDTLPVVITMSTANADYNLNHVEMVDSVNNVTYTVDDSTTASTTQTLNFENLYFEAGTQYNFEIRGDVPAGVASDTTYQVSIDFSNATNDTYVGADEAITNGDYSSVTLTGKTMTVATPTLSLAKITTNNATYVENAKKVLLYKGKAIANGVDNIKITRVKFDGDTGTLGYISDAFNKLYLNQVNDDGSETTLDTETSLGATTVSFSGFTLNVPKGVSNGVTLVIRGDVKDGPTAGKISFNWNGTTSNYTAKDSDNNNVTISPDPTDGHTTTIASKGTYTMDIDTNDSSVNKNKNVLAYSRSLLGRIKLTAQKENAILEDLDIQATSSADYDTLATLHLYDNKNLSGDPIASVDLDTTKTAHFEDFNYEIPVSGSTYLYIAGDIKGVDYSESPSADATAAAGTDIELTIPADGSGKMSAKVMGASTGEELTDPAYTGNKTKTSTVMGGIISAFTSDYEGALLGSGSKKIFSFKVTAPANSNIDFNGDPLPIFMDDITFTTSGVSTTTGTNTVTLSNIQIERVGGSLGKQAALDATGTSTAVSNDGTSFVIDLQQTYAAVSSTTDDLMIDPGETAEYAVYATLGDVDGDESVQVYINNLDNNAGFAHYTSDATTQTGTKYALLPGVTTVGDSNPGINKNN